jgi:hypothetical protein
MTIGWRDPESYGATMHNAWTAGLVIALLALTIVQPARAGSIPFGPDLTASGWQPLTFTGISPTQFTPADAATLNIRSEASSSLLWRPLEEADWPVASASWQWRVDASVAPTLLDRKGKDDRAIAIFFLFARDDDAARKSSGSDSLSSAMWWSSGSALVYVWGGDATAGTIVPSPQMGDDGRQIILHNAGAALDRWTDEAVDLRADFQRAFGRAPGPLIGIAIASDSDDTNGLNIASIRGLSLTPPAVR